jgi:histone H3/H4
LTNLVSLLSLIDLQLIIQLIDAELAAVHAKRVTVFAKDLLFARRLRGIRE